jgi:hypothetical protein
MPGVPEQATKKHDKEVESATQTDDNAPANGGTMSEKQVDQIKHDPKAVVHCELQEELDKEFEQRGLHFDSPTKSGNGGDDNEGNNKDENKQNAGDDRAAS